MLRTARLLLRPWWDADLPAFAALNADPEVRRWSRDGPLTREQSDAQAAGLRSYATEAARAALDHGFGPLGLAEVVAFTALGNLASRRVMERIGMRYDSEVDQPGMPEGDPLRRTVLYRARQGDGQGCALRDPSGACLGP